MQCVCSIRHSLIHCRNHGALRDVKCFRRFVVLLQHFTWALRITQILRLLNHTANACIHLQQNSQTNDRRGYGVFCHLRGKWCSPSLWSDVSGLWRLCRGDDRLIEGVQCRRRPIMWGKWGRVSGLSRQVRLECCTLMLGQTTEDGGRVRLGLQVH